MKSISKGLTALIIIVLLYFVRQAIKEIECETKRAAIRAETSGASGWKPCPLHKTNKTFLSNTMRTVISHNKRTDTKHKIASQKKFEDIDKRKPKFGARLHMFQASTERLTKSRNDK